MSAVFLKLLNLSITASWLILAVILARFLLKKAPKWISCVLWALVAIRLICPFSLESALSLVPSSETVNTTHFSARPYIQSGVDVIDNAANDYLGSHYFEGVTVAPSDSLTNPINVISIIWIIGMAVMLLYALISYIRLKKSVGASVPVRDNILACDEAKSPFILGIIKPLIYVPSSVSDETLEMVTAHEKAHIKRLDPLWRILGYLLLSVYWFNPLCHISYALFCRDMETACDESVVRKLDKSGKAAYSQALLDCSLPRRKITVSPLAFGEIGVKERVKSVLNYKKPTFWVIIVALILCAGVVVFFMTDPFSGESREESTDTSNVAEVTKDVIFEPIVEKLEFKAQYIRTNGAYYEAEAYPKSFLITSEDELSEYYSQNKDKYDLRSREERDIYGAEGFSDAMKKYDGDFFKSNDLILIALEESSGSIRHEVTAVKRYPSGLDRVKYFIEPEIKRIVPEVYTCDMAKWHIIIELSKEYEAGISQLKSPKIYTEQ